MRTFVLLPGAASDAWYWHLVVPGLQAAGHDVLALDLPCDDDSAGFEEHADVAVEAVGDRTGLVLVAQSLAGFTAPLVAARRPVDLIVLVAAMVPAPGESGGEWWGNVRQPEAARAQAIAEGRDPDDESPETLYLHDVPEALWTPSEEHVRDQSGTPLESPWPLEAWPDVPTRFLLCQDDRLFPADLQRRVVAERLGITPDEMPGGHLPALAHPDLLTERLLAYEAGLDAPSMSDR